MSGSVGEEGQCRRKKMEQSCKPERTQATLSNDKSPGGGNYREGSWAGTWGSQENLSLYKVLHATLKDGDCY